MLYVALIYILACFAPCFAIGFFATWLFKSWIARIVSTVIGVSVVFILGDVKSFLNAVENNELLTYMLWNMMGFSIACLMPGISGMLMQVAIRKRVSARRAAIDPK